LSWNDQIIPVILKSWVSEVQTVCTGSRLAKPCKV
jgi:hypothetical protein